MWEFGKSWYYFTIFTICWARKVSGEKHFYTQCAKEWIYQIHKLKNNTLRRWQTPQTNIVFFFSFSDSLQKLGLRRFIRHYLYYCSILLYYGLLPLFVARGRGVCAVWILNEQFCWLPILKLMSEFKCLTHSLFIGLKINFTILRQRPARPNQTSTNIICLLIHIYLLLSVH